MKVILQKVNKAYVSVEDEIVGSINKGYCLLVGIHKYSTEEDAKYLAKKIIDARLFEDENGKINLSLADVKGEILSISQFTIYADTKKGKRPSFTEAATSDKANYIYKKFNEYLESYLGKIEKGIFQTHMKVSIENDGPVTIIFEKLSKRE